MFEKVFVEMHIDLLSLNIYIVFFDINVGSLDVVKAGSYEEKQIL